MRNRLDDRELLELAREPEELAVYLTRNSNLPGPRSNLELAAQAARVLGNEPGEATFSMLCSWAQLSLEEASTNTKREFLPVVAVQALGVVLARAPAARRGRITAMIRAAAGHVRWRTREAAAMALQLLGEHSFAALRAICEAWLEDDPTPMEQRAVIAALAHPPILGDAEVARYALEVGGRALTAFAALDLAARKSEDGRVLKKGLEYALSVFVAALPGEGFAHLRRWAASDDLDVKKILAANLRKARLARHFPEECTEVGEVLAATSS